MEGLTCFQMLPGLIVILYVESHHGLFDFQTSMLAIWRRALWFRLHCSPAKTRPSDLFR